MDLKTYLLQKVMLSQEAVGLLDNLADSGEFEKGYHLFNEGSRSRNIFYIEEGLLRIYYLKDGKDVTHEFFTEDMFYVPIENVFLHQYYPYNFEVLETSKARTIAY